MTASDTSETSPACPSCGAAMRAETTTMPMWLGSELNLIEEVPAHVCDACDLQHFSPETEAAIRRVVASGFPDLKASRRMVVAVFRLGDFNDETAPTAKEAAE